jgi:hypothetical protein
MIGNFVRQLHLILLQRLAEFTISSPPLGITTKSVFVFTQARSIPDIRSDCRSLRQPRFSQALFESREVLRPAKREHALEIGNPQRGIDLAQARHGLVRLIWLVSVRAECHGADEPLVAS